MAFTLSLVDTTTTSQRVLVVEDEADLRATLDYNLKRSGYQTILAANGTEALEALRQTPHPDLVLLDVLLPDRLGTEICRRIRSNSETKSLPIIMLTACDSEIDRVKGFEVGADDYVAKPFSIRELLLRISALLRRTSKHSPTPKVLSAGSIRLDLDSHRAWAGQKEVTLCALEFRLLSTLVQRKNRVQQRSTLLNDVWGLSAEVQTRTVDVHIKRVRDKLGATGRCIETVHGVGYRLSPDLPPA